MLFNQHIVIGIAIAIGFIQGHWVHTVHTVHTLGSYWVHTLGSYNGLYWVHTMALALVHTMALGSYREPKVLNVLELNYFIQVPLNVIESLVFSLDFLNILEFLYC